MVYLDTDIQLINRSQLINKTDLYPESNGIYETSHEILFFNYLENNIWSYVMMTFMTK